MVKTLLLGLSVGALGVLGACTTDSSTPLKDLGTKFGATTIEIFAQGQVNALLHVAGDGCPTLSDDAVATFDGQPMVVARGGSDTDATGCYPIAFSFNQFPAAEIGARERSSGAADLLIKDASASWRVSPTQLFGNDLELDAVMSAVVWPNVDRITEVVLSPEVAVQIEGSNIYYPAGTKVTFAQVQAHPTPTVCDGPGSCSVDLSRTRSFTSALPQ